MCSGVASTVLHSHENKVKKPELLLHISLVWEFFRICGENTTNKRKMTFVMNFLSVLCTLATLLCISDNVHAFGFGAAGCAGGKAVRVLG